MQVTVDSESELLGQFLNKNLQVPVINEERASDPMQTSTRYNDADQKNRKYVRYVQYFDIWHLYWYRDNWQVKSQLSLYY